MGEGHDQRSDEPNDGRQGGHRDPFWLQAAAQRDVGGAFGRLADLTDEAAGAARRAAEAIGTELESLTAATEDAEDQGSDEAQLLHTARARLASFDREASGLSRLLRQAPEPKSSELAEPDAPESVSHGARMLARQMAADGYSPERIEARLTDEFGVSDARAVVEQVLRSK